jgi:hypothetical protein
MQEINKLKDSEKENDKKQTPSDEFPVVSLIRFFCVGLLTDLYQVLR